MVAVAWPENEVGRLAALKSYQILDTPPDPAFDELTELAGTICQAPISVVSFTDQEREWFKSANNLPLSEIPRAASFFMHGNHIPGSISILSNQLSDGRFRNNPLLQEPHHIAFYAGIALVNKEGFSLGTLSIMDNTVRHLSESQQKGLLTIASQLVDKLELRRKEKQLQEAQRQMDMLMQQSPVAAILFRGPQLVIEMVNTAMLKILRKDHSIVGLPLLSALPELDGQPAYDRLQESFQSGHSYQESNTAVQLESAGRMETRYFNFTYLPLREDGAVTGVIETATEITEQYEAKKRAEEAEAMLRLAMESAELGSWTISMADLKPILSDRALSIMGFPPHADLNRELFRARIHPDFIDRLMADYKNAVENCGVLDGEYLLLPNATYAPRWVKFTGAISYNGDGQAQAMSGTLQDISDRKLAEQRKDDFISIASHELKTPVTTLKASLQLLQRMSSNASETVVAMVDQANRSTERINSLINELLHAGRLNQKELPLNKSWFRASQMLNECCGHVRVAGQYELVFEGNSKLKIYADQFQIEQVIINLVNNAIKYAPDSRQIFLKAEVGENAAILSVRDTGPGIEKDKQPHLFERYYRVHEESDRYTGLGLGLYIAASIVKRHGGEIGVDSTPGAGSTFWFSIPQYLI